MYNINEKQMTQKSDRMQNVKDTLCYVCDKKIGDRPYRRLPKDSKCSEERLYHERCGCGSKNWNEKFPKWALHTIDKKLKGGHKIMSAVTLEQLKELAKQLNEILEPAIDLELAEEELKHKVIIAIGYVQPDDDLSADALQVIEALKQEQSTLKEETEMPKKSAKKVEKKAKEVKKDVKKDSKKSAKKVGKVKTEKGVSKTNLFIELVKDSKKKGITMSEIKTSLGATFYTALKKFVDEKSMKVIEGKIFYCGE